MLAQVRWSCFDRVEVGVVAARVEGRGSRVEGRGSAVMTMGRRTGASSSWSDGVSGQVGHIQDHAHAQGGGAKETAPLRGTGAM